MTNDRSAAVVFPFDNFGHAGTGAGAVLLGDVLREAIDDSAAESEPVRPHCYAELLDVEEFAFDTPAELAKWRATGRRAIKPRLAAGTFTLWLAGNHLGVLPVFDELSRDDVVIQLDAHLDCYDLSDTSDSLSHGNYLRHVAGQRPRVVVVGHRDLFLPPERVRKWVADAIPAEDAATDFPAVLAKVRAHTAAAKRVWLDLDADAVDPASAPAVHAPLPFGLTPHQLWAVVDAVGTGKLAGVSVSEFDPGRDVRDATLQLLAWLLERVLLRRHGG